MNETVFPLPWPQFPRWGFLFGHIYEAAKDYKVYDGLEFEITR